MGQTLSEPVVEKESAIGQDGRLAYGISAMQGWRISMEDAHSTILDLVEATTDDADKKPTPVADRLSFFGVYDGHGGDRVAVYVGDNIHNIIAKTDAFKKGDIVQALKDGFLATDRAILADPLYEDEVSGCTACVCIISDKHIYTGNAGDSRAVLGVKGRAKPLSSDHKPQNEAEKARINAAGGFVDFGRVNGNLALSRAIGDFEFKKGAELAPEQQIVTAFPDVTTHNISTDDDEFIVVACDGIWDCQSSQAVIEFVRRGIAAKQSLAEICENMMDNCLASNSETGGVGCDNMTMSIVALLHGKTLDEWYAQIVERVANGDGPCAPPEYAEFRGPGVHHNFDDSDSGYDAEQSSKGRTGGKRGNIILLGDGTELQTDQEQGNSKMFEDEEMRDVDEDEDLESQVVKGQQSTKGESKAPTAEQDETSSKTPEPQYQAVIDEVARKPNPQTKTDDKKES